VADTIADEVTFGWPRRKSSVQLREHLALNLQRAVNWVPVFFFNKKSDHVLPFLLLVIFFLRLSMIHYITS
jgi:hypothetical protein